MGILLYLSKRRELGHNNLNQIKAEMETVYNVQGQGEDGKTLNLIFE